jgi:uncharacterized lipoprotein YddW (UPF0748 family)
MIFFIIISLLGPFVAPKPALTSENITTFEKLKGICVRADDLTKEGVDKALSKIASYGYNAIFLLVKYPEGEVVFSSKNFPVKVDALSQIISSAKKYNLKVYAYFPVIMDKTFATKNPSEKMDNLGYETNTYYVSLLSKKYIDYLKLFLKELLQYNITDIVFDYIRYPNGSYDFCNNFVNLGKSKAINMDYVKSTAKKTFVKGDWKTMFMLYESGDKDIVNWVNLRESVLQNVVSTLKTYALSIKPDLKFGAFLVSHGYEFDYIKDAPSITESYAYQKVNFAYFGDTFDGMLDYVIPMVYLSSLKEKPVYAKIVADKIKNITDNLEVFIAINPASVSISDTELEIYYAYLHSSGIVMFRYPLFTLGKISPLDEIAGGKSTTFSIENSKGEKRTISVTFSDLLIPPVKNEICVEHFYQNFRFVFTVGENTYQLNNETFSMDVAPILQDDRTFIPIRFLSEALGLYVEYISKTKEIIIGNNFLKMQVGNMSYLVNGEQKTMDVVPFIQNSRTYVPLRFIMEAFGFNVDWEQSSKTVTISGIARID